MKVYRIYVEKKEEFAIEAKNLNIELRNILNIKNLEKTRIINRYDVEGIEEKTFNYGIKSIFSKNFSLQFLF